MAGKEPDVGASSLTVAENIRRLREALNMNYTQLADRVQRHGRSINAVGIRRTEAGERRVTPDDLVVFAMVLNVSPASLLMPNLAEVEEKGLEHITGYEPPITASHIWRWLTAAEPLVHGTTGKFLDHALPSWERRRRWAELRGTSGNDQ